MEKALRPKNERSLSPALESWRAVSRCSQEEARRYLSYSDASERGVLPLAVYRKGADAEILSVLLKGEADAETIQFLQFKTGLSVTCDRVSSGVELGKAIFAAYHHADVLESGKSSVVSESFEVPTFFERLLRQAVALSASDIHLEPLEHGFRIRLRVDGFLRSREPISASRKQYLDITRYLKLRSGLDTTLTSQPQEGGFSEQLKEWNMRVRSSFLPSLYGEKIVLRLLQNNFLDQALSEKSVIDVLPELGMQVEQIRLLVLALNQSRGAVILSGPTGSGKSTLLYACLEYLNQSWRNVITIEDPVERICGGLTQIDVSQNPDTSFLQILRSVLRQDPDVVMVGEVRDKETAETALAASLTGHLVLTSVHAGSALEAVSRLRHLGVPKELLSRSVSLIISQRLLPRNCHKCSVIDKVPAHIRPLVGVGGEVLLKRGAGCDECSQTGTLGRVGVFEFLPFSSNIRCQLERGEEGFSQELRLPSSRNEFQKISVEVQRLLEAGVVSVASVLKVLGVTL